jgi:drug/metabolite transporter (DMT)-like permease
MPLSPNQRGALFMVISQAAFTLNDTLVKIATGYLPVSQIMLVRGLFATTLMLALVWRLGHFRPLRTALNPTVALRVIGEVGGTVFFLLALAHLPLANASAVFQSLPLVVTMGAALVLGEYVGPRRWLAIAVGFVGVMIIVRPGLEGFNAFSIYVLLSVLFCTLRDLVTRLLPADLPTTYVSLLTAVSVTVTGGVMVIFQGDWEPLNTSVIAILAGAAVLILIGYQTVILSTRTGDLSYVAPFRYTALLWAIGAGFIVFGSLPDALTLVGSAIVVASGIYMVYRERKVGRDKPATESIESTIAPDGL